jgi:excisionase family DNA binding protein
MRTTAAIEGTAETPRAVTITKAAELLGLPERTVRLYVARGDLPSCRLGRRRLIPLEAIRRLVESAAGGGTQ